MNVSTGIEQKPEWTREAEAQCSHNPQSYASLEQTASGGGKLFASGREDRAKVRKHEISKLYFPLTRSLYQSVIENVA